jgi:hypothetical protein
MPTRIDAIVLRPLVLFAVASTGVAQSTVRPDADASGRLIGSNMTSISGDGRWILLETGTSAVAQDINDVPDVYARDRWTGSIELVSVATSGAVGDGYAYLMGSSPDARFVLFGSDATNFGGPPPMYRQEYVRDRTSGTTTLVSCDSAGLPVDGTVWSADMSDDGRAVVFATEGTNLGVPDPNGAGEDVYLRDLVSGTTTLVSATPSGTTGSGPSSKPTLSGDGRWIAYITTAGDILPPGSPAGDLLVFDRASGATTRVTGIGGASPDDGFECPSLSFDGRWLAFVSPASNLVAGDTVGSLDAFVLDRSTGAMKLLSRGLSGGPCNDMSFYTDISRGGERVVFHSRATDLVPSDTNGAWDAFVAEVASGVVRRVSVSSTGYEGDPALVPTQGAVSPPAMSDDGRFSVFVTDIKGLVAGDTDDNHDPFLRDELSPCALVAVSCTRKVNSAGCEARILSAGDPYASGPDSFYVCALDVLPDRNGVFVWSLAPASIPFGGGTLCVAAPRVRTPVQNSGLVSSWNGCTGRYGFHFAHGYQALHGVGAGTTVHGQFWSRDPGFAQPDNVGLTDAIRFTLGP